MRHVIIAAFQRLYVFETCERACACRGASIEECAVSIIQTGPKMHSPRVFPLDELTTVGRCIRGSHSCQVTYSYGYTEMPSRLSTLADKI